MTLSFTTSGAPVKPLAPLATSINLVSQTCLPDFMSTARTRPSTVPI